MYNEKDIFYKEIVKLTYLYLNHAENRKAKN